MRKSIPIPRIGWKKALVMIRTEGYRLLGRELISPKIEVPRWNGIYGNWVDFKGEEAEYYLTASSLEQLKKALKAKPTKHT